MKKYVIFLVIFFCSCQTETNKIKNEPASVATAWQTYLDQSNYAAAMELSSPEAQQFVAFLKELENDVIELDSIPSTTVLKDMRCREEGNEAVCTYIDEFGKEDQFDLIKIDGKWVVHLLYDEDISPDLELLLEEGEEILEEELENAKEDI